MQWSRSISTVVSEPNLPITQNVQFRTTFCLYFTSPISLNFLLCTTAYFIYQSSILLCNCFPSPFRPFSSPFVRMLHTVLILPSSLPTFALNLNFALLWPKESAVWWPHAGDNHRKIMKTVFMIVEILLFYHYLYTQLWILYIDFWETDSPFNYYWIQHADISILRLSLTKISV